MQYSIFFNIFSHYEYRCAEQILKDEEPNALDQPFLNSIVVSANVKTNPIVYALACGDIEGERNIWLTDDSKERNVLKNIAPKIVYLQLGWLENNFYLQKDSECQKLLNNTNNKENKFCIVFNNPHQKSRLQLHVMVAQKKNENVETTLYRVEDAHAVNDDEQKSLDYVSFVNNILTDSAERTAVIKKYMHSQFTHNIAITELARLSIENVSHMNYYLTSILHQFTVRNLSYLLLIYIMGILCYKGNIPIVSLVSKIL